MNKDTDNVEVNIVYKNRTINVPINITMSIHALTVLLKSYSITGGYYGYTHNNEYHYHHGYGHNHYNGYNYGKNNKGEIRIGVVSDHKPPFVLTKFPNEMLLLNFRIREGDRFYVIFEDDYGIPNTPDIHKSCKQYEPYKPYKSQKNIYIKTLKRAITTDNHRMVEYILDKKLVDLHSDKKLYEKCINLSKIHSRTYIQNLLDVVAL